jgi:hypothetical protein
MKLVFTGLLLVLIPFLTLGQDIKRVTGKSSFRIESSMSLKEAEEKAIELAKVEALTNEFGQYVEQQSNLDLKNGRVDFQSYGQTKVKGEWIRNLDDPKFSYPDKKINGGIERWIECTITGEARKATPKADIDIEILACPDKKCITDKFKNDQDIYLYVKSPISGYLSVFLDDGISVYRLLPYRSMEGQKSVKIAADKEYILFSSAKNAFDKSADALQVYTEREVESNTLVVVFSENDYSKPRLNDEKIDNNSFIIPQSLDKVYFEKWLGNNRAAYTDFLDLKRRFVINRN